DRVRVVGRQAPVAIHVLVGDADHAGTAGFNALAKAHARFLELYRRADLVEAEAALEDTRKLAPADLQAFYDLYGERLQTMRRNPPAGDWDGVFAAGQK